LRFARAPQREDVRHGGSEATSAEVSMERWSKASSRARRSTDADAARSRAIRVVMQQAAALRNARPVDRAADRRGRFRRAES